MASEVIIRPAVAADQEAIKEVIKITGINPMNLNWERFVVGDVDGRVVATGQVKPHSDGSRELASIATLPEFQRQGIATRIVETLLAKEPDLLYLMCESSNGPFYERFGFYPLKPDEMPKILRRYHRIGNTFMGVIRIFNHDETQLWIMKQRDKR